MRYAVCYLLACVPAAVTVVVLLRYVVGTTYEPHYAMLLAEQTGIPDLDFTGVAWLVSVIAQAGLFFRYVAAWIAPDLASMSIDIRIDFLRTWSAGWNALKLGGFAAFGILGFILLLKRGRTGLIGFGLLYIWIIFLIEFSAVRFQEPFVLYRSYLWAPGILIASIVILGSLPRKAVLVLLAVACPVLFYQANDRLQTFSSPLALWTDAAAADKLPSAPVPWGWRPLTNLAREQVHEGQIELAIETINRCLSRYAKASRCHFARGAIHNYLGEYEQALKYLDRAIAIYPEFAVAYYQRAVALRNLGQIDLANAAFMESTRRGYFGPRLTPKK
jgi:tetratricopeptide (TPR) repeat protein